MIHLERGPAPDFWTRARVKAWTERWLKKGCDSRRWAWPQYDNRRINDYAREAMRPWHHAKCAFCEAPLMGSNEIEHFRSKTKHPLAAFVWRNLFLICQTCNQSKGVEDHEGCLKPDRDDPTAYLWINPISFKIEARPGISEDAKSKAERTIKRYKLDRSELTKLYKEYYLSRPTDILLRLANLERQSQTGNIDTKAQISLHLRALEALTKPDQPFSLLVKSLLEYGGSI